LFAKQPRDGYAVKASSDEFGRLPQDDVVLLNIGVLVGTIAYEPDKEENYRRAALNGEEGAVAIIA